MFTRYLYEKARVRYSILYSLVIGDREQAKFWAYEIYYSGFKDDLFIYFWKIYYYFYSYSNFELESYLLRKTNEWIDDNKKDWIVGNIIDNFYIRKLSIDSYLMIAGKIENPDELEVWFSQIKKNENKEECLNILNECYDHFKISEKNKKKVIDDLSLIYENKLFNFKIFQNACCSRIMTAVYLVIQNEKFGKKMFVSEKENKEEIKKYQNPLLIKNNSFSKRVSKLLVYPLHISPNQNVLTIEDYKNWVYDSYETPIWKTRIEKFGGKLSEDGDRRVVFETEESEEKFYNKYDFDPDEQSRETQQKWFGIKLFNSWDELYEHKDKEVDIKPIVEKPREENKKKVLTEDLGKIFEMAICLLYDTKYGGNYKYSMEEANKIKDKLHKLKSVFPFKIEHIAKNGNKYDFVTTDGDKIFLSAKTTKKSEKNKNKDSKVCPQVIGQPSKKKFCEFFGIDLNCNLEQIKNYIQTNVKSLLETYELNTFDCPIVYYNEQKNMILFIKLKKKINWKNYDILFSHIDKKKEWNESSTIKINETTIGEFQIHNHRDCIKFRWLFEKLLSLFKDNFEIVDLSL